MNKKKIIFILIGVIVLIYIFVFIAGELFSRNVNPEGAAPDYSVGQNKKLN